MKKHLFTTSLLCSLLVCIFMRTPLSLNGYKTDFYFFIGSLLLNASCFWIHYKADQTRRMSHISLSLAMIQGIGLWLFLWAGMPQVDKVYMPRHTKHNLYVALVGWYKKAYFKPHGAELCYDGELWETKVPYYFPLIEVETHREQCHKVGSDSAYTELYKHVPE
jgi:hypothetical protein